MCQTGECAKICAKIVNFWTYGLNYWETVGDRWIHAAMHLTSIESSSYMWHLPRFTEGRRPTQLTHVPLAIAILVIIVIISIPTKCTNTDTCTMKKQQQKSSIWICYHDNQFPVRHPRKLGSNRSKTMSECQHVASVMSRFVVAMVEWCNSLSLCDDDFHFMSAVVALVSSQLCVVLCLIE